MLAKRASEFVLALIPELVGNFFDCHRSLKKQVTRLLHTEPKEKLSGRDTENVFEAMAHGVVIGYLTDLVDELMARNMTGMSAGFCLRKVGGCGSALGRLRVAAAMADCTSCRNAHISGTPHSIEKLAAAFPQIFVAASFFKSTRNLRP